ncbi:rhomboid family intramembrane serine protease [candidate division KSB1 bacterium]|nr:rhomboid family intramembrane serine protease [candidate division KSB1 bacterium]
MYYEKRLQFGFGGGITPVVRNLLIANVSVYVIQAFTGYFTNANTISPLIRLFGLTPSHLVHHFRIWQLFTYLFLHGNLLHIFFNMFALWVFGCELERYLGSKKFLRFYLITGVGAGLLSVMISWNSSVPIIGASGAIYGVLVGFAVLWPNRIITLLLFFILPIQIKAKYLVSVLVGISLFSGIQSHLFGVFDRVAHFTHLGGAMIGFLMLRGEYILGKAIAKINMYNNQRSIIKKLKKENEIAQKRKEIDQILDRINQVGYDAISDKEKKILKQASEYFKDE